MNIVVDMHHPGDVHLFKHLIKELEGCGHRLLITTTDKDVTVPLLKDYGYPFKFLGSTGQSLFRKALSIPTLDYKFFCAVKDFKPDLCIGHGSIRVSHIAKLMGIKSFLMVDTEASIKEHIMYIPFADVIASPSCYRRKFRKKQHVHYPGYHELAYLHPNRFAPDPNVLEELGVKKGEDIFIIRFIAWNATHDIGQHGFSLEGKRRLIDMLSARGRVFITSEKPLEEEFKAFTFPLSPTKLHDALAFAKLHIGEGATIASEAAALGVPVVFVSTLVHGYLQELEEKYGLIYTTSNEQAAFQRIEDLLAMPDLKKQWQHKRERLLKDKVDVTQWMLEFINRWSA